MARDDMAPGSAGGGKYQGWGVGNSEMTTKNVTLPPLAPDAGGAYTGTGESAGAGVQYSATINERPNIANTHNKGPDRTPSETMSRAFPVATIADRKTGKL